MSVGFLQSAGCGEHDDRKGHHYYTRRTGRRRSIVVMTLAVIMLTTLLLAHKLWPETTLSERTYNILKRMYNIY